MRHLLLPVLLAIASLAPAQSTIRVMDYNLLNFPEPNPAGKGDTLRKIIAWHPVDLLICEEVRTLAGAQAVLDQALNVNGETRFSMAAWEPMHSDPWADYDLQQIIYYDHTKLTLKEQTYLLTYVRDINVYTLYLNDADLATTHDTTFLTVFAVHLKAGNTPDDATERNAMAQVLVDHLPSLPSDRHVIVAGDMNVYTGYEDAFQALIDNSNAIVLEDPVNTIGNWNNNSTYAAVHTQSTRMYTIYGDGAGGGLDDRFDIALLSTSLMDQASRLHYTPGTYHPLGNSGTCFNQNITDCDPSQTPPAILRSLYYMSDHLPLVLDLGFDGVLTGITQMPSPQAADVQWMAGAHGMIAFHTMTAGRGTLTITDMTGRTLEQRTIDWSAGTNEVHLRAALASGTYVLDLRTNAGPLSRTVQWIER